MTKALNIKSGPHTVVWGLMFVSGYGEDGKAAQYRRLGRSGKILKGFAAGRNTLNLTAAQVEAIAIAV